MGMVGPRSRQGCRVRLSQSDLGTLEAVQRMPLRLGITSTIYRDRRAPAGPCPTAKGGLRDYDCAAQHELVISGDSVGALPRLIGFCDDDKELRQCSLPDELSPNAQPRARFAARSRLSTPMDEAEGLRRAVPGTTPLMPTASTSTVASSRKHHGACLLGSINLVALIAEPFTPNARLDLDAPERLVLAAAHARQRGRRVALRACPRRSARPRPKRRVPASASPASWDALILLRWRAPRVARRSRRATGWAVQRLSYLASADIAAGEGQLPLYDRARFLAGETIRGLPEEVGSAIGRYGIRNALLNSIAPTGTIRCWPTTCRRASSRFSPSAMSAMLQPDG